MPILMLLLGMILTIIIVVFALQNGQVVTVGFFDWRVEASLVLVIILSALMGFFAALFFELFVQLKLRYRLYKANKQLKKMEEEITALKKYSVAQSPVLTKPTGEQEPKTGESVTIV
ncbi:MAG: lipopolysaccharide assembly LapA domain-containing protein [Negativicutes bacterium]